MPVPNQPQDQAMPGANNDGEVEVNTPNLRDAFQIGWALVELRSRVQIQLHPDKRKQDAKSGSGDALLRGSQWNALLNQIAVLHDHHFQDSELQLKTDRLSMIVKDKFDELDLGFPKARRHNKSVAGSDNFVLPKFDIYERTRQALKRLNSLYLESEDTLIWDSVKELQEQLIMSLGPAPDGKNASADPGKSTATLEGSTSAPPATAPNTLNAEASPSTPGEPASGATEAASAQETDKPRPAAPPPDPRQAARKELTDYVVQLLVEWENYVRNRFNLTGLRTSNEILQVAFEAGRNIASMTWCVSIDTVGQSLSAQDQWGVWNWHLAPTEIIRVQRQVAALGNKLDECYCNETGQKRVMVKGTGPRALDSKSPAAIAAAINRSLDYWQRAIELLGSPGSAKFVRQVSVGPTLPQDSAVASTSIKAEDIKSASESLSDEQYRKLRAALIEQSDHWHLLLTGQESLEIFSGETLRYRVLGDVYDLIQGASLDELREGTTEIVKEARQWINQAATAVDDIAKEAKAGLSTLLSNINPISWLFIGIVVMGMVFVAIVLLANAWLGPQGGTLGGILSSLMSLGAGLVGYKGLRDHKDENTKQQDKIEEARQNSAQSAATVITELSKQGAQAAQAAGNAIGQQTVGLKSRLSELPTQLENNFQNGLAQLEIEIQRLDLHLGAAAPLLEFFLLNFDLEGDVNLLTQVLWNDADRQQELESIKHAAFGPLSFLLPSQRNTGPLTTSITSVSEMVGTNKWEITGSVRGKGLQSWELLWSKLYSGRPGDDLSVPLDEEESASKWTQPIPYGRLGILDVSKLGLQPGDSILVRLSALGPGEQQVRSESTRQFVISGKVEPGSKPQENKKLKSVSLPVVGPMLTKTPTRPFDPHRDGFTFPNSWQLSEQTADDVRARLDGAIDTMFALLPFPLSGVALQPVIRRAVDQWVAKTATDVYGLCGGMSFAALDYYLSDCARPTDATSTDEIPPELRRYILERMKDSFLTRAAALQPDNVSQVLAWMVVEHWWPRGKEWLMQRTMEECEKLHDLIAQYGAWPIALIGEEKDPCKNHQVLAYNCPYQWGNAQTVVSIYDVNYPGPGYDFILDFSGRALHADIPHPGNRLRSSWEPLRALFCEAYSQKRPDA